MIREIMQGRTLIFGCGNILFGDDGFGPAVIERLREARSLPDGVVAEDVGTSVSDILFDLALADSKPEAVWIVDAVDLPGRSSGEVFELALEDIPDTKQADFSLHQFPAVNLLQEMRNQAGIEIRVLAAQVESIPEEVRPGLSASVRGAIDRAVAILDREALPEPAR